MGRVGGRAAWGRVDSPQHARRLRRGPDPCRAACRAAATTRFGPGSPMQKVRRLPWAGRGGWHVRIGGSLSLSGGRVCEKVVILCGHATLKFTFRLRLQIIPTSLSHIQFLRVGAMGATAQNISKGRGHGLNIS